MTEQVTDTITRATAEVAQGTFTIRVKRNPEGRWAAAERSFDRINGLAARIDYGEGFYNYTGTPDEVEVFARALLESSQDEITTYEITNGHVDLESLPRVAS